MGIADLQIFADFEFLLSCTNEVSCAELNRISVFASVKTGSICLNQSGSFDGASPLPHFFHLTLQMVRNLAR